MRHLLPLLVALVAVSSCTYERPDHVPQTDEYWLDPPYARDVEAGYDRLGAAIEPLFPVFQSVTCRDEFSATLPVCNASATCRTEASHAAAVRMVEVYGPPRPEVHLPMIEAMALGLQHAETLLVPGLSANEWSEVVNGACESSPLPAYFEEHEELGYHYGMTGDPGRICALEVTFVTEALRYTIDATTLVEYWKQRPRPRENKADSRSNELQKMLGSGRGLVTVQGEGEETK